ncbi:universal stress protein [Haliscomenobacter hydrossis]|uniref:UspA domain-containing protein n=1 Tax=Haliscomenobacter hydrossis (strain ATCC 27775 / DSM 1100 / LMG 10767 / O) TaxID=760192 RepID=F4L4B8_HALH1|nr:universal stress protein [Haliscomenobacter hydrossis]AEE51787.1 UspA domain-containing protein [Haliscomenobacter hydrossis DSM 1100]
MDSILCLTDFHHNSAQPFRYGLHLTRHLHNELYVAHVEDSADFPTVEDSVNLDENIATEQLDALQKLRQFIQTNTPEEDQKLPVRGVIVGDNLWDGIEVLTGKYDADLIIMGMRNRMGLAGRIFGGLASKMINLAEVPVLMTPPGTQFTPIKSVVYATDFDVANLASIEKMVAWCQALDANLYLVHVNDDPADNAWAKQQMEKIMRALEEDNEDQRVRFTILEGDDIMDHLEHYMQEVKADLIALTAYRKGFWDRILRSGLAHEVIQEVNIPVLIFKS